MILPAPLIASALEALPTRLRRRAESLEVTPTGEHTATVGSNTVTFSGGELSCDCLLSPRCAHIGAVALAAEPASDTESVPAPDASTAGSPADAAESQPRRSLPSREAVTAALNPTREVLDLIVEHGLLGLGALGYAQLIAALHGSRVVPLPRLERQLTGLVALSQDHRAGKPLSREAAGRVLGQALLTLHLLERDPQDAEAIGTARRAYSELTPGRDDGTFIPLWAEPVLTNSGFAGVVVTLAGRNGALFTLAKTPPGALADVARVWHGPVRLGDIHASFEELSRRKVIISGGTASKDGRIGSRKGIRAALGADVAWEDVPASEDLDKVEGPVTDADLTGLAITGRRLTFTPAARACGVAGLVALLLPDPESTNPESSDPEPPTVKVAAHDGHAMAIWLDGKRYLPGLDERDTDVIRVSSSDELGTPDFTPAALLQRWLERAALRGRLGMLDTARDAAQLRELQAPTAARLVEGLGTDYGPRSVTALAAYLVYLANGGLKW